MREDLLAYNPTVPDKAKHIGIISALFKGISIITIQYMVVGTKFYRHRKSYLMR